MGTVNQKSTSETRLKVPLIEEESIDTPMSNI